MIKKIILCGSGEFSREVYNYIITSEKNQNIKFKGFLDSSAENLVEFELDDFYLGHEDNYEFKEDEYVLIAIADAKIREKIFLKLKERVSFFNYIHETVFVGKNVSFGEGNIFSPHSVISCDIKIGNCNIFNCINTIGHDVEIGSFNTISAHCDITGNSKIGNGNFLGSSVSILPKSKIGNNNKISAKSVIYKKAGNNGVYHGNPARKVDNN